MTAPTGGADSNARPPTATLSLFTYEGAAARAWAFAQMGLANAPIARSRGLRFHKMIGCGYADGFGLRPSFGRYGLFAVWDSADDAERFLAAAPPMRAFRARASEVWIARMVPVAAHGAWSGASPLAPCAEPASASKPVAVMTRARLRPRHMRAFFASVSGAERDLRRADGLLAAIGVGDVPFLSPATFSFWRSEEAMTAFAYGGASAHRDVVRRTRAEGWYGEELFARLRPVASEGTWDGRDPLEGIV